MTLKYIELRWVCFLWRYILIYFVFWISVVLHPSHKLTSFEAANWEDEWVSTAEEIVHTEFSKTYANVINEDLEEELTVHASTFHFNFIVKLICIADTTSIHFWQYIRQSSNDFCSCESWVRWWTYSLLGCTDQKNFEHLGMVDH